MTSWGALLLILAVPLLVIGGAIATGFDPATAHKAFLFASLVFATGTLGTTVQANSRKPDLTKGIDEQAITLFGVLVGASAAFGLGALSFALATGWPLVGLACAAAGGAWFALWLPPRLRLMTGGYSMVINRDVPTVFALLSDFRTMVTWYPGVESVEMLTPEPIGPGSRFRGRAIVSGNPVVGVDQIIDYEPNRLYTSTTIGSMKNLDTVTFEPSGPGTRVSVRIAYELQLWMALIGVALFKSSLARSTLNMRQAAWAKAKELLESGSQSTP